MRTLLALLIGSAVLLPGCGGDTPIATQNKAPAPGAVPAVDPAQVQQEKEARKKAKGRGDYEDDTNKGKG